MKINDYKERKSNLRPIFQVGKTIAVNTAYNCSHGRPFPDRAQVLVTKVEIRKPRQYP